MPKKIIGGTYTKLSQVLNQYDELKQLLQDIEQEGLVIDEQDDIGNILMTVQDRRLKLLTSKSSKRLITKYDKLLYKLHTLYRETDSNKSNSSTFCHIPWHDCLISDMQEPDYQYIQNVLGISNLDVTLKEPTYPVSGIFHGIQNRMICPLILSRNNKKIWVICLIDTGSALTYLTEDTFQALTQSGSNFTERLRVNLHGLQQFSCRVTRKTDERLGNVNVIGQDFLKTSRIIMTIDYNISSYTFGAFTLNKATQTGRVTKKKSQTP
jgi:hypothetical protein